MMNNNAIKGTATINFIEFKKAMKGKTKAAGKVIAYYKDYVSDKINVETFFKALVELNREHRFILDVDADNVVCELNMMIESEVEAQFNVKTR